MPHEFIFPKTVEFNETDMAGIVHFANFFHYMEIAEHAFLRSLGFSVHNEIDGVTYSWPRVHADCDYRKPIRFEDTVEIQLLVREKKRSTVDYYFVFRNDGEIVAVGSLVTVCITFDKETGAMNAVEIPPAMSERIDVAPADLIDSVSRD